MDATREFLDVIRRFRDGDPDAADAIVRRFVHRLTALASKQFDPSTRDRADPEGVVQSVYKSFIRRDRREPFDLDGWERLWSLLAVITVRKCARRRREWWQRAGFGVDAIEAMDRGPTPAQAAILADLIALIYRGLHADDHLAAEMIFQGCTAVEIAAQLGCSERTVRRLRDRIREIAEGLASGPDAA